MSIADKLKTIAENEQKVFDAGAKAEYDKFWDGIQNFGARTSYDRAFIGWSGTIHIQPKYVIAPTTATTYLFSTCTNLKEIDASKFDFSGLPENYNVKNAGVIYAMFNQCTNIETVPDLKIPATVSYGYFCYNCTNLKTVEVLRVSPESQFDGTFSFCENLENLTIEGTIGQNKFSVTHSTKLTHDSLMSIINALQDKTADTSGTSWVCTLGATNLAKLTDAEKQIATGKGWTLA